MYSTRSGQTGKASCYSSLRQNFGKSSNNLHYALMIGYIQNLITNSTSSKNLVEMFLK